MEQLDHTQLAEPPRRRRRGLLVLALAGTLIVTFGASAISLALFTDTASTDTGAFTTGTIDISTTSLTSFKVDAMMPGDSESATLTVANGGTGQLRYAMSSTSTNTDTKGLAAQLQLEIREGACPSTGAVVYSDVLDGAGFGSSATGADDGDRVLDAATSESFCFTVSLPPETDSSYMGATTTTTFTFDAEQTANN
jgi:hypothetical protein